MTEKLESKNAFKERHEFNSQLSKINKYVKTQYEHEEDEPF